MNATDSAKAGTEAETKTAPRPHDPFAPSTGAVRVFAGIGLLLLAVTFVGTLAIVLHQAFGGDGASGPMTELAMWSLGLSGLVGLWALCLPRDAVDHGVRCGAVVVQYALAVAGPLLASVDLS
ncbi:hypothetical protein [Streptomyces sp. CB03234]|uniref:hypothetical protein n=1 Tax=Streptomyces sp. (strain CB03234) TaxID=1703937 RepID=UPI00117EEA54|nr:hypothetical protein [Streptomyces sp. CB03234]